MSLSLLVRIGISRACQATEKIVLAGSQDIQEVPQMKWLVLIYTDAFQRLGYEMQYDIYPLTRLTSKVDAGEVDGEIQRHAEYQSTHPNPIRVDESPASVSTWPTRPSRGSCCRGGPALKQSEQSRIPPGESRSEAELKTVVAPGKLSEITTTEQGLKKLVAARTDVFVDLEHNIDNTLKQLNLSEFDMSAVYQAGIM